MNYMINTNKGHVPHSIERTLPLVLQEGVVHYTCNAPTQERLDKYGIQSLGHKFGCASPREVVVIPLPVYREFGLQLTEDKSGIVLLSETLMRELSR